MGTWAKKAIRKVSESDRSVERWRVQKAREYDLLRQQIPEMWKAIQQTLIKEVEEFSKVHSCLHIEQQPNGVRIAYLDRVVKVWFAEFKNTDGLLSAVEFKALHYCYGPSNPVTTQGRLYFRVALDPSTVHLHDEKHKRFFSVASAAEYILDMLL